VSTLLEQVDEGRHAPRTPRWRLPSVQPFPLGLGLLGIAAQLLGIAPLGLLSLVAVTAWIVPATTTVTAAFLALPVLVGAACVLLTVTAVAGVGLFGTTVVLILLVVVTVLAAFSRRRSDDVLDLDDVLATLSAAVTFVWFFAPFVGASAGRRLALLSFTTDAANHLQLVRAVMEHGGFVTLRPGLDEQLFGGMQDYPPGFSGALGSVLQSLQGSRPTLAALSQAAAVAVVALYALLAWLGTRLALALHRQVAPHAGRASAITVALVSTGFFVVGYNPQLLRDAAFAQILATAAVLAGALVLTAGRPGPAGALSLGLLGVTLMDAWYLLAPVLALVVLAYVLRTRQGRRPAVAVLAAMVPFWAFPVLTGPGRKHLSVPGFLFFPTAPGVLAVAGTVAASVVYLVLRPGTRNGRRLPLALVAATFGCTVLIGAYQTVTDGTVGYYSVKLLYTTFVVAGCVTALVAGLVWGSNKGEAASPPVRRAPRVVGVVLLAVLVPAAAMSDHWLRSFVTGLPVTEDQPASLDLLVDAFPHGVRSDQDVWVVDGCAKLRDFVLSKWVYDLSLGWSRRREVLAQELRDPKKASFAVLAQAAASTPNVAMTVYVHTPCRLDALATLEQQPNVTVVRVP
jgi:hypothetical protein